MYARIPSSSNSAFVAAAASLRHREGGARSGIEVDAQLVGVVGIARTDRPRVEAEAADVDRPQEMGEVGDHERARFGAVGRADDGGGQPVRRAVGHALLEERRTARAVREALHQHRSIAHGAQHGVADRHVEPDEVELGLAPRREEHLVRAGDRDLARPPPPPPRLQPRRHRTATVPRDDRSDVGGHRTHAGHDPHRRRRRRRRRSQRAAADADRVDEDAPLDRCADGRPRRRDPRRRGHDGDGRRRARGDRSREPLLPRVPQPSDATATAVASTAARPSATASRTSRHGSRVRSGPTSPR